MFLEANRKGREIQHNGGLEVLDGELVLARLNWVDAKVAQAAVCAERMKLLLLLVSSV